MLKIPSFSRLKELAQLCGVPMKKMFDRGGRGAMPALIDRQNRQFFMRHQEKTYSFPTKKAVIVPFPLAKQFALEVSTYEEDAILEDLLDPVDIQEQLLAVPGEPPFEYNVPSPICVFLGEKDHGKTTLINGLTGRQVVEVGGITQRVGAAKWAAAGGLPMTFLDTPGHEHFREMRRGMSMNADMAVIAVACDEGFTARTKECISLVLDAKIPVAFVFTKWDLIEKKDDASSVEELAKEVGNFPGFVGAVTSSVDETESLDAVKGLLARWRASIEDSGSSPIRSNGFANGCVLDSYVDPGKGLLIRVMLQEGALAEGDSFVCGLMHGTVRAMFNAASNKHERMQVTQVGEVVDIMLRGRQGKLRDSAPPRVGEGLFVLPSKWCQRVVGNRLMELELPMFAVETDILSDELYEVEDDAIEEVETIPVIIKADTSAGLESLVDVLLDQAGDRVRVVHSGLGPVSPHDVAIANLYTGDQACYLVALNIPIPTQLQQTAVRAGVRVVEGQLLHELVRRVAETVDDFF